MERAVILATDFIRTGNLPADLLERLGPGNQQGKDILRSTEREIIVRALSNHGGNRRLAAAELGISRRTLQYKLKEYGLLDDR